MTRTPGEDADLPPKATAIADATGTDFLTWAHRLDEAGARELDHGAIAALLLDRLGVTSPWWAQSVTIAYEQWIGRRVVGQTSDGTFSANVSRTLDGDPAAVRDAWGTFVEGSLVELGLGSVRSSDTPRRHTWRADGDDGSRLTVSTTAKTTGRCVLALSHERLGTAEQRENWKSVWAERLDAFTADHEETT